jgi:2-hydroxychromene-2-carboxylate isomerase
MSATDFDFWFTMGSTYTCLSALRIPRVERTTGVEIRWRPCIIVTGVMGRFTRNLSVAVASNECNAAGRPLQGDSP